MCLLRISYASLYILEEKVCDFISRICLKQSYFGFHSVAASNKTMIVTAQFQNVSCVLSTSCNSITFQPLKYSSYCMYHLHKH